jgi:hypothetical protein
LLFQDCEEIRGVDLPTSISVKTLEGFNTFILSLMADDEVNKLDHFVEGHSLSSLDLREVVVKISDEELIIEAKIVNKLEEFLV